MSQVELPMTHVTGLCGAGYQQVGKKSTVLPVTNGPPPEVCPEKSPVKRHKGRFLARWTCHRCQIAALGVTSEGLDGGGLDEVAGVLPAGEAAIHGEDVGVAHALEIVGRQGRAIASAAVEDDFG